MITEGNVLDFCRLDPECSEMTVGWFSSSGFGLFGYHWVVDTYLGGVPPIPIEPRSPALQVDSLPAEPEGKPTFCFANYKFAFYVCESVSVL